MDLIEFLTEPKESKQTTVLEPVTAHPTLPHIYQFWDKGELAYATITEDGRVVRLDVL